MVEWPSEVSRSQVLTMQFEPTRENGPSSSVGDLFDSFRSASDFLAALNWPDEYQLAQFSTKLAKVRNFQLYPASSRPVAYRGGPEYAVTAAGRSADLHQCRGVY